MAKIGIVCLDMTITGGAEQVAANLANAFSQEHEVFVISVYAGTGKPAYTFQKSITYQTILPKEERLRKTIRLFRKPFRDYVNAQQIEVLFLIGDYPGIIALAGRGGVKAKFIFCEHGALMNQWKERDIRFIRFFNACRADQIVTLTKSSRDSYIRKFHVKANKVQFIYNWIDDSVMEQATAYDSTSHKIMSVGRFGPEKGQDLLVQVAEKVLKNNRDWVWEVYGDGETLEEIQTKIRKLGIEHQLRLKGNDPDVKSKYGQYAFFVLTSYREGLPLVLLEAKANHLPMVSFDILTGPSEIIKEDGFLIPPYDTDEMSEKIEKLMKNVDLRERMSKKTTDTIDIFSQKSILLQWLRLISKTVDRDETLKVHGEKYGK